MTHKGAHSEYDDGARNSSTLRPCNTVVAVAGAVAVALALVVVVVLHSSWFGLARLDLAYICSTRPAVQQTPLEFEWPRLVPASLPPPPSGFTPYLNNICMRIVLHRPRRLVRAQTPPTRTHNKSEDSFRK